MRGAYEPFLGNFKNATELGINYVENSFYATYSC